MRLIGRFARASDTSAVHIAVGRTRRSAADLGWFFIIGFGFFGLFLIARIILCIVFFGRWFGKRSCHTASRAARPSASRSGSAIFGHRARQAAAFRRGAVQRIEQRVQRSGKIAACGFTVLLAILQIWLDVAPVAHDDQIDHLPAYPWVSAGQSLIQIVERAEHSLYALIRQGCFTILYFPIQAVAQHHLEDRAPFQAFVLLLLDELCDGLGVLPYAFPQYVQVRTQHARKVVHHLFFNEAVLQDVVQMMRETGKSHLINGTLFTVFLDLIHIESV